MKLKNDKLTFIKNLHNNEPVYLCRLDDVKVVYKEPKKEEREYEVAGMVNNIIEKGYNKKFKTLALPKFYEIDESKGYLLMEYCGDNDYIKKEWESGGAGGGKYMQLRLSEEMADMIYDFSIIRLKDIEGWHSFAFDFNKAKEFF